MRLTVEKSDGGFEPYHHTKVLGTFAVALGDTGDYDPFVIDELSAAVALYLNHRYTGRVVSSDEIHSILEVALSETGFHNAAQALHTHRFTRQIRRSRLEVISSDGMRVGAWNKSFIVRHVVNDSDLDDALARPIAAAVEQKVLAMECFVVTTALIRELLHAEVLAVSRAWQALTDDPQDRISPEIFNVASVLNRRRETAALAV